MGSYVVLFYYSIHCFVVQDTIKPKRVTLVYYIFYCRVLTRLVQQLAGGEAAGQRTITKYTQQRTKPPSRVKKNNVFLNGYVFRSSQKNFMSLLLLLHNCVSSKSS